MPVSSTSSMKASADSAAKASSKRCARTACTPYCSRSLSLAGGRVSRNGPVSGTKKRRGCGSKVSATTGAFKILACSAVRSSSA
jgi:hypothetical protein